MRDKLHKRPSALTCNAEISAFIVAHQFGSFKARRTMWSSTGLGREESCFDLVEFLVVGDNWDGLINGETWDTLKLVDSWTIAQKSNHSTGLWI